MSDACLPAERLSSGDSRSQKVESADASEFPMACRGVS